MNSTNIGSKELSIHDLGISIRLIRNLEENLNVVFNPLKDFIVVYPNHIMLSSSLSKLLAGGIQKDDLFVIVGYHDGFKEPRFDIIPSKQRKKILKKNRQFYDNGLLEFQISSNGNDPFLFGSSDNTIKNISSLMGISGFDFMKPDPYNPEIKFYIPEVIVVNLVSEKLTLKLLESSSFKDSIVEKIKGEVDTYLNQLERKLFGDIRGF